MKQGFLLIIASTLSVIFMTIHLAGDIIFGMEKGGPLNLIALPILTVWLYGTLVLAGKRLGYIIMLLGALFGLLMPIIHMTGNGISSELLKSGGSYMFVWTLIALGVTSLFSLILSVIELWKLGRHTNSDLQ